MAFLLILTTHRLLPHLPALLLHTMDTALVSEDKLKMAVKTFTEFVCEEFEKK